MAVSPPAGGAASQQELLDLFTAAYERRDIAAIEALAYWPRGRDNADDQKWMRSAVETLYLGESSPPKVQKAQIVSVPSDQAPSHTIKGVRYAPALPATGKIEVTLQPTTSGGVRTSSSTLVLIGEHGGRHYLSFAFPSESVAADAPAGTGAIRATLGTVANNHRVSIKLNGVAVPSITGGSSQAVAVWASDEPTADLACLRRGTNTIEIRYEPIDPATATFFLSFYMIAAGYTQDVFLFEPENKQWGMITRQFEIYDTMPPGFQTLRLDAPIAR